MRKSLLVLLLCFSLLGFSQPGNKLLKKGDQAKLISDSSFIKLKSIQDSMATLKPEPEQKQWQSNLDGLLRLQQEQRARQKKEAYIRIGIGLALLIVLLIGLNRRRGKNKKTTA